MAKPLTELGKALEANRIAAGLAKTAVAERMDTRSRGLWDRITTTERPTVDSIQRAAAAVGLPEAQALRLAGYNPELVTKTRQQSEQPQTGQLLAG